MPSKSKPADSEHLSEQRIRERAYLLWEADGRPPDRGDHYWYLAQAEARKFVVERTANAVARVTQNPNAAPASVAAGLPGVNQGEAAAQAPKQKPKPAEARPRRTVRRPRAPVQKAV